jgi:glucokinase
MEALGEGLLVVVIGEDRAIRLARDVACTGTQVLLLTSADVAPADNLTAIRFPVLDAAQLAVLEILPIQLLSSEMAAREGREVQGFRYEQADTKLVGSAGVRTGTTIDEPRRGSLGIDVGGSKLAVALTWGHTGNLEFFDVAPTPKGDAAEVLRTGEQMVDRALEVARRHQIEISGIGVAVPEVVGLDGRILSQVVVPGLDADEWRRRLGGVAQVTVESDVRAGAKAEAVCGAGRARRSFCYVTVGTGISYALVLNGVVHTGARGAAIQLGNLAAAEWEVDGATRQWILEEIASGPAMLARYLELGGAGRSPEEILRAFGREQSATRAVEEAARAFGIGVALLVNLLDPELVVVGGGLGSAPGPFWELSVASARAHIACDVARGLPILQAHLGPRSSAVGAAIIGFGAAPAG